MRDFKKYDIWIDSMELVKLVYKSLENFPRQQKYGLTSQIGRCVISIPSNISEGAARRSEKEFARFIEIALGSSFELETQLIIAKDLSFITNDVLEEIMTQLISLQKRLNGFRNTLLK